MISSENKNPDPGAVDRMSSLFVQTRRTRAHGVHDKTRKTRAHDKTRKTCAHGVNYKTRRTRAHDVRDKTPSAVKSHKD